MERRRFLTLGAGGALAAALSGCGTPPEPRAPPLPTPPAQDLPLRKVRAVIWLWMGGGQSQLDTWDPKPGSANGGAVKAIDTDIPGIRLSEYLPVTAAQMKHLSILRTVSTHQEQPELADYLMHCGLHPNCADSDAAIGTILAYELWNRELGAPPFVTIHPPRIPISGVLGNEFLPVVADDSGSGAPREGADARRALLQEQEKDWASARAQRSVDRIAETRGGVDRRLGSSWREAMDISGEPEGLRASYGAGFGMDCLKARRLIQAGIAVVEIGLSGWDGERVRPLCAEFDAGFGTLIRDLVEKEMLRDTVVVCIGPHGRNPMLVPGKVRGPWAKGFSVVVAGGSLEGGRVYGDTGLDGDACIRPVPVHNLFGTILRACGVDGNRKYETEGRKVKYVSMNGSVSTSGTPLKELF